MALIIRESDDTLTNLINLYFPYDWYECYGNLLVGTLPVGRNELQFAIVRESPNTLRVVADCPVFEFREDYQKHVIHVPHPGMLRDNRHDRRLVNQWIMLLQRVNSFQNYVHEAIRANEQEVFND